MNYFGELKKATLMLAWGTTARNGYVSCHGGLKIYQGKEEKMIMLPLSLACLVHENQR